MVVSMERKKSSAYAVSAEQCKSTKLPNLLQKFCADDIYNVNETGLFCHAMLGGSLSYKYSYSSVLFKESNGLCNCVVLSRHVKNW
jgi:hypothetical protein